MHLGDSENALEDVMIYDHCPCCEITRLPHEDDCTFSADCPAECEVFDEIATLRAEIDELKEQLCQPQP